MASRCRSSAFSPGSSLLPTFKFLWAPLLDRYAVPGFTRFWGKRRGWIMLSQLGIVTAMVAMAFTSADDSLALTALFAVLLAFWTTTLEVAADALAGRAGTDAELQGPLAAANLWGYRTAMVAAGSGALLFADVGGLDRGLSADRRGGVRAPADPRGDPARTARRRGRAAALVGGLVTSAAILLALALATAVVGWLLLGAAGARDQRQDERHPLGSGHRDAAVRGDRRCAAAHPPPPADARCALCSASSPLCRFLLALRRSRCCLDGLCLLLPHGRRAGAHPVEADDPRRATA